MSKKNDCQSSRLHRSSSISIPWKGGVCAPGTLLLYELLLAPLLPLSQLRLILILFLHFQG